VQFDTGHSGHAVAAKQKARDLKREASRRSPAQGLK
jgi:hypothetical protein